MSQDDAFLLDMLLTAREAMNFVGSMDASQFHASKMHQFAVIRALEIIGEAARNVSRQFCDAHPEIPWRDVIGMRNRLIHNYSQVSIDIVWDVMQNKLAELIAALSLLVPRDEGKE